MSEWQPIETAPKNGKEILCWVGSGYTGGHLMLSYIKNNGTNYWGDWDLDRWEPTHWMPLSEPPKGVKNE